MTNDKDLESLQLELIKLIKDSKISTENSLHKIELHLNQLKELQEKNEEKIDNINNLIFNPDAGLYKRINDINHILKNISSNQSESSPAIEELQEKVDDLEETNKNLLKIAGDRLENLDSTIKTNQNSKKILWTFIIGGASIALERIFELLF